MEKSLPTRTNFLKLGLYISNNHGAFSDSACTQTDKEKNKRNLIHIYIQIKQNVRFSVFLTVFFF